MFTGSGAATCSFLFLSPLHSALLSRPPQAGVRGHDCSPERVEGRVGTLVPRIVPSASSPALLPQWASAGLSALLDESLMHRGGGFSAVIPQRCVGRDPGHAGRGRGGVVGGRPGKQGQEGQGCFRSGKGSAGHRSATWLTAQSPPERLPSPCCPASPSPEAATALRASSTLHQAPAPSTVTFRRGVCTRCCNGATNLVA